MDRLPYEQEGDLAALIEDYLSSREYREDMALTEAFRDMFHSAPVQVRDIVTHWNKQGTENPLWSDEERYIITVLVQMISGKHKKDALALLQKQINSHDGMSNEATFARMFSRELKYGKETLHRGGL